MAAVRYAVRTCSAMIGCDGEVTHAKDGVCQNCKDRVARIARGKKEYVRAQELLAQAARNGRHDTSEAR